MNKIPSVVARVASILFHPLLIPTLGFLLLFNSGFFFALIPWNVKRFLLLVVFITTCVLPALSIGVLSLNKHFDIRMEKSTDRAFPLIFSSISYYLGYLMLRQFQFFPIYQLFLVSSILVQIALLIITLRWKISAHTAAIGGLTGGFLALSVRYHENPTLMIAALFLVAGIVASSRLILAKHSNAQVYSGFLLGFSIMCLVFLLI